MSPDLGTRNPHLCSPPTQLLPGLFLLEKNLFALTSPEHGSSLGPLEPETSAMGSQHPFPSSFAAALRFPGTQ